ncbi:MAG: ParA family protein [Hyphomicrobiaceae bacterium]
MDWSPAYNVLIDLMGREAGIAILTVVAVVIARIVWRELLILHCFLRSRSRALSAVARQRTRDGLREGKGLWLHPTSKPDHYDDSFGTRVLVVANNKGGVAKTTLVANLGAFWAREWKKRVLLIDLDYQGTLSSMALRAIRHWMPKDQDSLATRAISGDLEPSIFVQCARDVPGEPRLKIVPAYYDLAQADNRLILEWLLQCAPRRSKHLHRALADLLIGRLFVWKDIRYNLAELLQTQVVREAFDIVVIDCPPRVTTGVIQAFCAGTHILIPTILDMPSSEAVVAFCEELQTLKNNRICPKISFIGVVGTMVSKNVDQIAERRAKELVAGALRKQGFPSGLLNEQHFMRESAAFVRDAEEGIAYLAMGSGSRQSQIREAMGSLARYVAGQVGLPEPQAHEVGEQS